MEFQDTIIHRLYTRNPGYFKYVFDFDFLGRFWGKMGRKKGFGPQTSTKNLAHWVDRTPKPRNQCCEYIFANL